MSGALPLWAVPGYECAFVMGMVGAPFMPALGRYTLQRRIPLRAWLLLWGVQLAYIITVSVAGRGCNVIRALGFWLLLPVISSLWGAALGAFVGAVAPRASAWLVWLLPWCFVARAGLRFLLSPTIHFYEPLWGYFAGSLYDELIDVSTTLVVWRLGSVVQICAFVVAALLMRRAGARLRAWAVGAGALVLIGVLEHVFALEPSAHQLAQALPCTRTRPGVVVHMPNDTPQSRAEAVADDHAFVVEQLARKLHIALPARPLHSFVFADAADKARWMGGRNTMVAKPWRHEIYLHGLETPHRLLPHEAVHALAAAWTPHGLHVPARLGVWVDMGLVEGLAVAMAPDTDALGVMGRARALWELGLLLPTEQLIGSSGGTGLRGFWRQPPARAYGQAGALLRFVHARFGLEAVRRLYRGETLEAVTCMTTSELDAAFVAVLQKTILPAGGLALVRGPLVRPSIFERVCVHEVARLREAARRASPAAALPLWQRAIAVGGGDIEDRLGEAYALRAQRNFAAAQQRERALVAQDLVDAPRRAELALAWALQAACDDRLDDARRDTALALRETMPTAAVRTAFLLRWSLAQQASARRLLVPLLAGDIAQDTERKLGAWLARLHSEPADASAGAETSFALHYLLGRVLARRGDAHAALDALSAAGPHAFVPLELERLTTIAALAASTHDDERARAALGQLRKSSWPGIASMAADQQARLEAKAAR